MPTLREGDVTVRPLAERDAAAYAAAFRDDPDLGRLLGMERIEIQTFPDNEAAKGLARSLGFVEEGVMRGRNLERGARVDLALFALLPSS